MVFRRQKRKETSSNKKSGRFQKWARALVLTGAFTAVAAPMISTTTPFLPLAPQEDIVLAARMAPEARAQILKDKLGKSTLGRDILAYMNENNVQIVMQSGDEMHQKTGTGGTFRVAGLNRTKNQVVLNHDITSDAELLRALVHETRHAWQRRAKGFDTLRVTPPMDWARGRFMEADAFAFEAYFTYQYKKETGIDLAPKSLGALQGCNKTMTRSCLVESYEQDLRKGLSHEQAYEQLLIRAFRLVRAEDYDSFWHAALADKWKQNAANKDYADLLKSIACTPTSEDAFAATMREMTRPGLDAETSPFILQGWAAADFVSDVKTGGKISERKFKAVEEQWKAATTPHLQSCPAKPSAPEQVVSTSPPSPPPSVS